MLNSYFIREHTRKRILGNRLSGEIECLVKILHEHGYSIRTVQVYVQAVEHYGIWLNGYGGVVDRSTCRAFIENHLPGGCRCAGPATRSIYTIRAALNHLLRASSKESRIGGGGAAPGPKEQLVGEYLEHLETNCGLTPATRHYRARYAREFLDAQYPDGRVRLKRLTAAGVRQFVVNYARRCKRSSAQVAAGSLRSFLRYIQMRGSCDEQLVRAVPWIPRWKLSHIPKAMTDEQLRLFLDSFDRTTPKGRRDYAMALCILELGLRVSEVVQIELDDIDWRNGRLRIHSEKQRETRLLPIPKGIGKAISSYLKSGRPASPCRRVFLRHSVPCGASVTRHIVRGAMRDAYKRSGCGCGSTGTHILRHTAATRMHRAGASLKEIADVLGHRSIETSTIYTKIDLPTLRSVVMPWPEVQP